MSSRNCMRVNGLAAYKISLEELRLAQNEARTRCGVYFLLCCDEVVYVGQSLNVDVRLTHHFRDKKFDGWACILCEPEKLNSLEQFYIKKFAPKYNKAGLTKKENEKGARLASFAPGFTETDFKRKKFKIDAALIAKLQNTPPPMRAYEIRDANLRGFTVRVYTSGRLTYSVVLGRGVRKTIGEVSRISAKQARAIAENYVAEMSLAKQGLRYGK